MSVQYLHEHLNCLNYDKSDNPRIEVVKIAKDEERLLVIRNNEIICVLEGRLRCLFPEWSDYPKCEGTKGQIFFLPAGGQCICVAPEDTTVMVFRLHEPLRLCEYFPVEKLYGTNGDGQGNESLTETDSSIGILDITPRLWHFLDGINDCIADGIKCRCYFEIKIQELFIMLRCYYPKKELHDFLIRILSRDTAFSEYVRLQWCHFRTVQELAGSMNMSTKQFAKKFALIFGETPYHWMKEGRAKQILSEITVTTKSVKQIAFENEFSTIAQFTKFCKKELGNTPTNLRANAKYTGHELQIQREFLITDNG